MSAGERDGSDAAAAAPFMDLGTSSRWRVLCLDVEAEGLYRPSFAVGAVVLAGPEGRVLDRFGARAPDPAHPDPFVASQVLPATATLPLVPTRAALREAFWSWYRVHAARDRAELPLLVVADCGYPVESAFLAACVADDPERRQDEAPYPLHELATLLLAAGMDPLGSYARALDPPPRGTAHDPRYDAEASGRLAVLALRAIERRRRALDRIAGSTDEEIEGLRALGRAALLGPLDLPTWILPASPPAEPRTEEGEGDRTDPASYAAFKADRAARRRAEHLVATWQARGGWIGKYASASDMATDIAWEIHDHARRATKEPGP